MKILNWNNFILEAFLQKDTEKAIDTTISYLQRKMGENLYKYDEIWNIQKGSLFLEGQLFISFKSEKAIRFNWLRNDLRNEIHSIDVWKIFKFDENPDFTMELGDQSIVNILPKIVDFIKNPKTSPINERLDTEDAAKRLEDDLRRFKTSKILKKTKIKTAENEKSSTESQKVNQLDDDFDIDIFKTIELYTLQVARGKSNSLIVSGDSGIGKSQTVKDALNSIGMNRDIDYYLSTGTATSAGLFELLFRHRKKLIIFDDCDSVLKDPESINILKGALDTYEEREISKITKTSFNSTGMTDDEIEDENKDTGKLPNRFNFTGQIIFISNLPENKIDKAILSRSLHVDVHLNKSELFSRMKDIMRKIAPNVDYDKKLEALEYLYDVCEKYPTKFDLNIRTLIHSINIRANNEEELSVGEKKEKIWKLLIKKYLIQSR